MSVSVVWPNEESAANSDSWLIANHGRITLMRPPRLQIWEHTKHAGFATVP